MEYKEILDSARTCIGPYCKACPVCNGKACGNQVPGPGAKAPGSGFIRNFDAWQKICVNMDTICPNEPVDTAVELFGTMYRSAACSSGTSFCHSRGKTPAVSSTGSGKHSHPVRCSSAS